MAYPVLLLGDSGSGKTTSFRNLDPQKTLIIQATPKPLPFRANNWLLFNKENPNGSVLQTDNYNVIQRALAVSKERGKEIVILDDFNYFMTFEEMRRSSEHGYSKFVEMAKNYWLIINAAQNLPTNQRIYFISHTQQTDTGFIKPKTTGKLLDEKICIEGLFSIVMRAQCVDGRHFFSTKTNGFDPVKTPFDLFKADEIDNDLHQVDEAIKSFYNL